MLAPCHFDQALDEAILGNELLGNGCIAKVQDHNAQSRPAIMKRHFVGDRANSRRILVVNAQIEQPRDFINIKIIKRLNFKGKKSPLAPGEMAMSAVNQARRKSEAKNGMFRQMRVRYGGPALKMNASIIYC